MSSDIITGKDAYVDGVPCTTSFQLSRVAALTPYSASCTPGASGASDGNIDVSGSMSGLGKLPPRMPGEEFSFKGVADNTSGDAKAYSGTALVSSLSLNIPVESNGEINWSAVIGFQGDWTIGTVGGADSVVQFPDAGKDGGLTIGATAITGIRSITLNFSVSPKPYPQSGFINRSPGNLTVTMSAEVYGREPISAYAANVLDTVLVKVGPSAINDIWEFADMKFSGVSNLVVDASTQDLIGFTINSIWSAVADNAGTAILGHIIKPFTGTVEQGDYLYGTI